MKTQMLTKARRLFNVDYMPNEVNRANQIKWARSVHRLGERWLLAKYVQRKTEGEANA